MKKRRSANPLFTRGILLSLLTVPAMLCPDMGIVNVPHASAGDISGRVIYVAENGNDYTGNGSSASPFRSIKKAADEATAGTTVLIRPGTYIEDDIRPKESGKEDAMIIFRPEKTSDMGKVIIKHKDVFNGSSVTPEVRANWLRDTGWSEDEVRHYDNAGIEYSIAGRKNELTDVFNLFGRDYIWIEGFVFEDYQYARSTINIIGTGNVVLNNQFKNIGCVYNAPWSWSNQGVYRPDVTIPVAGPDNVIRNNFFQSVYGETLCYDNHTQNSIISENTFIGAIGKNSTPLEAVGARDMHLVRIQRAEKRVLVINNVGDAMGTSIVELHKPGELVTIDAKSRPGYTFEGWQPGIDAMEVTPVSADGTRATFIMPAYNQRIQAKWKLNGQYVHVSGISLSRDSLAMNAGDTETIAAAVSPNNATDKAVLWTSSNPLVASVDKDGVVTALSEGTAEIIARTLEASDKQFTAKCKVSVTGSLAPAGDVIEAEDFNEQSGIDIEECKEGGSDVAYIENGDSIGFHGINFGRGSGTIEFRIGANSSGGAIEVHLGSPDGKLIGSMDVSGTGGWQNWKTQKCSIDPTTGVNDVYFVFKGGEGYLFNLNWFRINYPYENDDLMGDVNLDGAVTVADAVMLQKWLVRQSDELTCWRHADICSDTRINAADLSLLKQMLMTQ